MLQAEDFEPHLGKTFNFDGGHALVLDRVERGGPPPAAGLRPPFIVIFRGPKTADHLREGLVHCEAGDGVAFDLYVSPVHTPAPDRQDYQAAFN